MQLDLKYFYQYVRKTFVFPDTGMVRLAGISGAGKSTVMKAIDYAVNGTVVKKSWHGGIPSVTLDWPSINLKIERYGTQTSGLTVTTENGELRDDQGQAEIYRKLCGSGQRFSVSSYIRQRMKGALINLGPAEQLRLIQSLAFGDEDPEITKAKVAATLKAKADAVTAENKQLMDREVLAADLKVRADKAEAAIVEPEAPCDPTQIAFAHAQYKTALEEQRKIDTEIRALQKEISNPLYTSLAAHVKTRDELKDQILTFESRRQIAYEREREVRMEEAALTPPIWDQALLDAKIKYLDTVEQAKALVAQVKERYSDFKGTGLGQWLAEQIALTKAKIDEVEPQHLQKMTEFQTLVQTQDGQPCPECGTALSVTGGKIHKHTGASNRAERIEAVKAEVATLGAAMKGLNTHRYELEKLAAEAARLKAVMGADPQPEIRDSLTVHKERKAIMDYATTKQRIKTEIESLVKEQKLTEFSLGQLQAKINNLVLEADAALKLVPIEHLREQEKKLLDAAAQKGIEINTRSLLIEKIEAYSQAMQKVNQARAVLAEIRTQQATAEGRIADQTKIVNAAKEAVGAWTRMRELSDMAATQAVEDTINDINGNAQVYLTKLFPDDGTVVRILNTTKNQKGDEKAKLSLEIVHKGFEAGKNDEDLSGGEQDRIALAFQMAMSDLYVSPILMVDEGFAGADVEKTLGIGLGLLQEYSANKLVLVIQHGAPDEFFDEVIELA